MAKSKPLTDSAKQKALELGADIVGIAPVERFSALPGSDEVELPNYFTTAKSITNMLPSARSVIVIALRQLTGIMESNVSDIETTYPFGNFGYWHINCSLSSICYDLARWLEDQKWTTLPLGPALAVRFHYKVYPGKTTIARMSSIFDLRRAAILAGVGRIAKSELLATQRYGTKIRLGAVITTAPLEGDPILDGCPCPPDCTICMDTCPMRAINTDGGVDEIKCYSDCGRRGNSSRQVIERIMKDYCLSEPGSNCLDSDNHTIDGYGSRICRVVCMALCPLGETQSSFITAKSKNWKEKHRSITLSR
jgi:epoxyqueuosine reductase QueG